MEIKLTKGLVTIVDDADYELLSKIKWQAVKRSDGKGWYAVSKGGIRMHRLIMGVTDDRIVDHRDGDGLKNKRDNLRIGNQSKNCVNRKTTPGKHLRGVVKRNNKYRATIKLNGKTNHLGYFHTELEAHEAYLQAATKAHGDWMPLPNKPE